MNEAKLRDLFDTMTVGQTTGLMKGINVTVSSGVQRRVLKQTLAKMSGEKKRRRLPGWAVPVAAAVCAGIVLAAVPQTANAIREFFDKTFSAAGYMAEIPEDRSVLPDVEAVVQKPTQDEETANSILLGEELEDWGDLARNRQTLGYPPFDATRFAWLKDAKPQVDEVLYDGQNVIITGKLQTENPLPFYSPYVQTPEGTQRVSFVAASLNCESMTQPVFGNADVRVEQTAYSEQDGKPIADAAHIESSGTVPFIIRFEGTDGLPEGMAEATVRVELNDGEIDDMGGVGKIAEMELRVAIDTEAGNTTIHETGQRQTESLAGEAIITVNYGYAEGTHTYGNETVSLDGMELSVEQVVQKQTGLDVHITEKLPASWSPELVKGYRMGYSAKYGGIKFMLVVDGVDMGIQRPGGSPGEDGGSRWLVELPILPADLAEIRSIELVPVIEYMSAFNDQPVPLGGKKTFAPLPDGRWEDTTESTRMDGCKLTIWPSGS